MIPKRIQISPGEPLPEGAVDVTRPSVFANPFRRVGPIRAKSLYRSLMRERLASASSAKWHYRLDKLAGHDLACTCALDQECHADVLLILANGGEI